MIRTVSGRGTTQYNFKRLRVRFEGIPFSYEALLKLAARSFAGGGFYLHRASASWLLRGKGKRYSVTQAYRMNGGCMC